MQDDDEAVPRLTSVARRPGRALVVGALVMSMTVVTMAVVAGFRRLLGGRCRRVLADALVNEEPGTVLMDLERPGQQGSDQEQG